MVGYMDYHKGGNEYRIPNGVNTAGDSTGRYRFQFRFMLDILKPDEFAMAHWCEWLKEHNKFTPTIRDAMALHYDLQNKNIDELSQQFPQIVVNIQNQIESEYKDKLAQKDKRIAELEAENRIKDQHIERLERILATRPAASVIVPQAEADLLDDDEIMESITTRRIQDISSGAAFLKQMADLQDEVQRGIAARKPSTAKKTKPKAVVLDVRQVEDEPPAGGPQQMDVPQFEVPAFDDDADLLEMM